MAAEAHPQETTVAMELRTTAAQVKGTNAAQQEQGIAPAEQKQVTAGLLIGK